MIVSKIETKLNVNENKFTDKIEIHIEALRGSPSFSPRNPKVT